MVLIAEKNYCVLWAEFGLGIFVGLWESHGKLLLKLRVKMQMGWHSNAMRCSLATSLAWSFHKPQEVKGLATKKSPEMEAGLLKSLSLLMFGRWINGQMLLEQCWCLGGGTSWCLCWVLSKALAPCRTSCTGSQGQAGLLPGPCPLQESREEIPFSIGDIFDCSITCLTFTCKQNVLVPLRSLSSMRSLWWAPGPKYYFQYYFPYFQTIQIQFLL